MAEADDLLARLEKLEAQAAFQEQTIEDLNEALTAQYKEMTALKRKLAQMGERLEEIGEHPAIAGAGDPPPPHY